MLEEKSKYKNPKNQSEINSFSLVKQNNDNIMNKITEMRNSPITSTARNVVFGTLILGGMFFASLFMFQILSGIIALFASVAILAGMFLGLRFMKKMDPLIQQKTKNYLLEKMFEEARENSIQQLNNHVLVNAEKLVQAKQARNTMGAMVENLKSKVDLNDTENKTNAKKIEIYNRVKEAYEIIKKSVESAEFKHKEFEQKVNDYKDLERFTRMAGDAMALFNSSSDTKLNEMLSLESFENIDIEFNSAIITIENNSRDMERENGR